MIILFLMWLVAEYLALVLHEGAHCLAAMWFGARIKAFRPYPQIHRGTFYFGRMTWEGYLTERQEAVTLAAPMFQACLLVCVLGVASIFTVYTVPFLIAEALDAGYWWFGWIRNTGVRDGSRVRRYLYG